MLIMDLKQKYTSVRCTKWWIKLQSMTYFCISTQQSRLCSVLIVYHTAVLGEFSILNVDSLSITSALRVVLQVYNNSLLLICNNSIVTAHYVTVMFTAGAPRNRSLITNLNEQNMLHWWKESPVLIRFQTWESHQDRRICHVTCCVFELDRL